MIRLRNLSNWNLILLPKSKSNKIAVLLITITMRLVAEIKEFKQFSSISIATYRKMVDFKSRALNCLGKAFALKKAYPEAAEIWETRLGFCKQPLEKAYMYHEIGLCYVAMHKFEMAKYYAEQALDEATKINDKIWTMNARIMLGQIEGNTVKSINLTITAGSETRNSRILIHVLIALFAVKNMNLETAMSHFEIAEEFARKCGNQANEYLAAGTILS